MTACRTCMNTCDMDKSECSLHEAGDKPKPVKESMDEMIARMLRDTPNIGWFPSPIPIQGTPLVVPFLDTEPPPNRPRVVQEDEQEENEQSFEGGRVFVPTDWMPSNHSGNIGVWDSTSAHVEENDNAVEE